MAVLAHTLRSWAVSASLASFLLAPAAFAAVGTEFTYQGQIAQGGTAVTGVLDLQFELYSDALGTTSVGGPITLADVAVANGLFTVHLDFGAAFDGNPRWLEIRVSPDFPTVPYVDLAPLQALTPTPYSVWADDADHAAEADHATTADNAINATNAVNAQNADTLDTLDSTAFSLVGHTHPASSIPIPAPQVVYGTGTGITGEGEFTYDATTNILAIGASGVYRIGSTPVLRLRPDDTGTFVGNAGNATATGTGNTGVGRLALAALTSGTDSVAIGAQAMAATTTGFSNVAVGAQALNANLSGFLNTAVGAGALRVHTGANACTAVGGVALFNNTTGIDNTAVGSSVLFSNTTGGRNTAMGTSAANSNTVGSDNTSIGALAGQFNVSGSQNTAVGASAMLLTTGGGNTGLGAYALDANTSGTNSTAVGSNALSLATTGGNNTAVGVSSLATVTTGTGNVAVGLDAGNGAAATATGNIFIGSSAGTAVGIANNNIVIGHVGDGAASGRIRLGTTGVHTDTRIAGIWNTVIAGPTQAVVANANGQLGAPPSSRRYKEAIRDMGDEAGDLLLQLRPVLFRYRPEWSTQGGERQDQYGLIAEEVEEVQPDWVVHDESGEILSVRYDQVNAALLGLVQRQQSEIDTLRDALGELAARLARLEATKP